MILLALTDYYHRISQDDVGTPPEGFENKEIPFIITLGKDGSFKGLVDTRDGEDKKKKGRTFMVPKAIKKSSNIAANLLWDNPSYVLGVPKSSDKKAERAQKQHQCFIEKIEKFNEKLSDEGVSAVIRFLKSGNYSGIFSHPLWPEIEERGANIAFQLEGETRLVCQREAIRNAISNQVNDAGQDMMPCLITGEMDIPSRLHTAIKGVWGAQSSGANIISFNLSAFNSYHKKQGLNAPVGKRAEHAYTTALNRLLAKNSRQRIQVGDATTVFWAEQNNKMEEWFVDFFGQPAKGDSVQDNEAIRTLYSSPRTGAPPPEDDDTRFYVLGLSPNASRISVRFWYAGTVAELAKNIKQHFDDCSIVHGPKESQYLSIFRLLVSTAVQGESKNIQPNLAGDMMVSILRGTPYPKTLMSSVIRRVRAEREITYPRASLIKAVLAREARYYKKNGKEIDMSLDQSNTNPGYLLGRLFAVLERAQERANPGIDATIRDRFYGAASSTPVTAFPHLLKLKNHHIAKLENKGEAVNLEKQLGEIMEKVVDFPPHLGLHDQGRFAIGYYHQRQDFFRKRD